MASRGRDSLFKWAVVLLCAGPFGCAQIFGLDKEYRETSGTAQGGGGSGGVGGTTGTGVGGTGGSAACASEADCPAPAACQTVTCEDLACVSATLPLGTPCAAPGGKVCDEAGSCVACNVAKDCDGAPCDNHLCVPLCMDGVQDGAETAVDCGGPCPGCPQGQHCLSDTDCDNGICNVMDLCSPASCGNGNKNGLETDLDCGGAECPKCAAGKVCAANADCASGVCSFNLCN